MAKSFNGLRLVLSWSESVRLHFLPTYTVLFYSFLMPWVRKIFLLFSALAGELFYPSLLPLPARGCVTVGRPRGVGETSLAAARNTLSYCLTQCQQKHEHEGLGLQTLNGVKLSTAPAEMIALRVVEGNCSSLD